MRTLTFIAMVSLFFSCGNKKGEIVKQIKALKDSCNLIDENVSKLAEDEKRKYNEIFHASDATGIEKRVSDLKSMNDTANNRIYMNYLIQNSIKKDEFKSKKKGFVQAIDSLELELKKY